MALEKSDVILFFAPVEVTLASFRIFPVSVIFCSLNVIRLGIGCFGLFALHLSCMVFSELPGPIVSCLTLIWRTSQSLLL